MLDAPHPRILFQDVPDPGLLENLKALAGTWGLMPERAVDVHASDWDLVVSFENRPFVASNMHLLSFGAQFLPSYRRNGTLTTPTRSRVLNARGMEVAVTGEVGPLLNRSVVANDPGPGHRHGLKDLPSASVPLVTSGDEKQPWAALLVYEKGPKVYAFPAETTHHVEWLAEVLKMLHELEPDRFPAEPDWRRGSDWGTPALLAANQEIDDIEGERRAALQVFEDRETAARAALEVAAATAAAGAQRLLTASGDDLVQAVMSVLGDFGFEAKDMDEHHAAVNGAKLEDLRVVSTGTNGEPWLGLVEIKGYTKGAKANDVGQIYGRPARAYLKETGAEADGLWHIVNVHREHDPRVRGETFTGLNDLLLLEDNGGCAIDTRDLFKAWRDVQTGSASADEVRLSLVAARGRWTWPER